ncbi:hypothetical protein [Streptomyces sp. DH10]|uniref:hypothetical protein n=1 Tax=Streptomyces sp. DH10 TaxID=3040121 RepID=UPI0024431E4B|nr:hypothetical protein [Streptomyces sp. DH10]
MATGRCPVHRAGRHGGHRTRANGAHYPSDVTVGAAIGLTSAWLTRRAPHLILRHWL